MHTQVKSFPGGETDLQIRLWRKEDSIPTLTELLRRAYAPLAAQGYRFTASWQDDDITRKRVEAGHCLIATSCGQLIGTITVYPPTEDHPCKHYRVRDRWHFGQFAVEPAMQGRGVGETLLRTAERLAQGQGATELALDTAEGAKHLIAYYERMGYQLIGTTDWRPTTNYLSVVMVKRLANSDE